MAETYTLLRRWGMGIIIGSLESRHLESREFGVTQAGFHFTTPIKTRSDSLYYNCKRLKHIVKHLSLS